MGYKVKSTGIPYRVSEGFSISMACSVTFTKTGTDEVTRTVQGASVNIKDIPEETLLLKIRMNLKDAVVAECKALDAEDVETTAMTNQKNLLQTALISSGWWFALLIAFLLWCLPIQSQASDLYPSWSALTNLSTGISTFGAGKTTQIGTIDCSGHYAALIFVNWEETGNNPTGSLGVSAYATESASGVTDGYTPLTVFEILSSDYSNNYLLPLSATQGAGVTKTYLIENIPYITIGVGKSVDEDDTVTIRYKLMKGQY